MLADLTIDVFSDVVCPWCFIGSVRLEQAIAALGQELAPVVRYHPFFIDPSVPPQGISVADKLRRQYGVDPKQLWARAESAARDSGLWLDLSHQPMIYPSGRAHTLIRHAEPRGTQRALVATLFRAYFLDAKNIWDETVLADLAEPHGFTRAEVLQLLSAPEERVLTESEVNAAARAGIGGVPFFIFGERLAVSGAQPVTVLEAALRKALAAEPTTDRPG